MLQRFFGAIAPLFFLVGCSSVPLTESEIAHFGQIIEVRTQEKLTPDELVNRLASHLYILIGEEHDTASHPQLEAFLVQKLEQKRPLAGVVLEMLAVDQQAQVTQAQLQAQSQSLSSAEMKQHIGWEKWDWEHYAPLVASRLQSRTPLLAANLTEAEVQTIMTGAEPLKGNLSTRPTVQQQIAGLIHTQHAIPAEAVSRMVQVQQFRDRRMAEKLQKSTASSVLIAGNHHVRKDIGVPLHLADFNAENAAQTVTLLLQSGHQTDVQITQADYIWLTY